MVTNVQPILKRAYFPKWEHDEPTKRPYRLYAAKGPLSDKLAKRSCGSRDITGRRYAAALTAHDQALLQVRWEPEGTVFEVYDIRTGWLFGTYERVKFNGKQSVQWRILKGGK